MQTLSKSRTAPTRKERPSSLQMIEAIIALQRRPISRQIFASPPKTNKERAFKLVHLAAELQT
jgi:hypothetical protein